VNRKMIIVKIKAALSEIDETERDGQNMEKK
jgi:hypothetical protein